MMKHVWKTGNLCNEDDSYPSISTMLSTRFYTQKKTLFNFTKQERTHYNPVITLKSSTKLNLTNHVSSFKLKVQCA